MKKRVLIVDDSTTNLYMLETILKGYGFEVISAENGKEALEKAHLNPPNLIVTDILMPVMDGYALCRRWRSDDTLKHIPLVFYTATYTGSKNEDFALGLGADRFILKPQEPDILMNILKEVLEESYVVKQVAAKPLEEEMEVFRQYNEILFKKLEKKMLDLEIANQELRILEERYRLSFDNVSDVIYTMDKDLNIISISPSLEKILGYKPQDFIGRPVSDLGHIFTSESFERAVADISLILEGETITATIYHFIAKDGTIKHGEVSGSPVMREGKVIGIISVARDITERKRNEEALRKSEEKYRGILDNMDDAYYELDLKGNLVFFNEALILKTGYSREELVGMNYRQYISPETYKPVSRVFSEIYRTGQTVRLFDYEVIMKDGQTKYFESWAGLLFDNNSQPIGFRGMARDITARKEVEKQLQKTLESLRKAVGMTIQVMVSAVEARDPYTAGHQSRVAELARSIATEMGLSQDKIEAIRMAGPIHDIGKLSVPAEILSKPTKLKKIEFSLIKEHAQTGFEMLKDVESPWPLAQIVYQHHERMDGSGYPRNLKGEEILIEARILAVSDVVESMASHRPYRPALGLKAALEEIEKNRGALYDADAVDACLRLFREEGFQLEGV
jgi:PAS domain S-box-containing protein/putative nucleotidyltransferase with HDIG domain